MAISLYDASIRAFLQTLGAIDGFLGKGLAHCRENGVDPEELVEARIFPDMHPLRFQIQNVFIFSVGAIEAIKNGEMRRPSERPQQNYAELQALVAEARKKLEHVTPDEINAREGAEVVQEARDTKRHFTAEAQLGANPPLASAQQGFLEAFHVESRIHDPHLERWRAQPQ